MSQCWAAKESTYSLPCLLEGKEHKGSFVGKLRGKLRKLREIKRKTLLLAENNGVIPITQRAIVPKACWRQGLSAPAATGHAGV